MDTQTYLDFDLLIQPGPEGRYRAQVTASPVGKSAAVIFNLPFTEDKLENFLLKIGRPRRGTRGLNSSEMSAAKEFGATLFTTVFADDVNACLRSSLDVALAKKVGLRLRLCLTEVPELADLPWEYLYRPQPLNRFLALSSSTPLVRYLDLPENVEPLVVSPPLRVLVLIASPKNYPKLKVEREWGNLKEALGSLEERGLVELTRLDGGTLRALQRQLRKGQYHVLHFIGHGGFDPQAQDGMLILEDSEGAGQAVSGQYLGVLLHGYHPMRLAVLNACEGARNSRTDPFAGLAQSVLQQGVPAVIAMQFEITDEAAISFAHEFYSALADNFPVDAALVEARKIMAGSNSLEWGTPVLYMRTPDGRIFDVQAPLPAPPIVVAKNLEQPLTSIPTGAGHANEIEQVANRAALRVTEGGRRKLLWLAGVAGALLFALLIVTMLAGRRNQESVTNQTPTPTPSPATSPTVTPTPSPASDSSVTNERREGGSPPRARRSPRPEREDTVPSNRNAAAKAANANQD